jgi:hypothetical protein
MTIPITHMGAQKNPQNKNKCMNLVFKIGLIGAVVLATAAFGGTEPSYFFPVQMVLLG